MGDKHAILYEDVKLPKMLDDLRQGGIYLFERRDLFSLSRKLEEMIISLDV